MVKYQHVPVRRLLLPVQRLLQHELCELVPVRLRLHIQVEEVVGAHVWVESALQREARAGGRALGDLHSDIGLRETGGVVIYVHHLDFHAEQLQGVLQKHLHVQLAARALLADELAVYLVFDKHDSVLQVHFQVRAPRARHHLKAVLRNVPHERSVFCLLRH
uniref:Uncharacterized protein n=1 Tax=Oryzias sinensis TaxID=183150 RepID=A0A8C7XFW1_9TELE